MKQKGEPEMKPRSPFLRTIGGAEGSKALRGVLRIADVRVRGQRLLSVGRLYLCRAHGCADA